VATAPATKLVRGPSDVTLGGHPAKLVVVEVRRAIGCDPGFFYAWRSECWGACWVESNVGDTIRVWIVSVRGKRLFFAAETTTRADRRLEREVVEIVDSIRFG
jgi:hypothetical protein